MKPRTLFVIVISLTFLYVVSINIISSENSPPIQGPKYKLVGESVEKIGYTEKVSAEVQRDRWYGRIVEIHGETSQSSYLYILNIIKLPLNIKGENYIPVHIVFILTVIAMAFFIPQRRNI